MNRDQKAAVVEEIAGQIEAAEAIFAVDYRGLSVPQAAQLRSRLRDADATFRIGNRPAACKQPALFCQVAIHALG